MIHFREIFFQKKVQFFLNFTKIMKKKIAKVSAKKNQLVILTHDKMEKRHVATKKSNENEF